MPEQAGETAEVDHGASTARLEADATSQLSPREALIYQGS
jgi:hypothetical protein